MTKRIFLRRAAAFAAAGCVAIAVVAVIARSGGRADGQDDPGRAAIAAYLSAWSAGDDRGAAGLTTAPVRARAALRASRRGMDAGRVRAAIASVRTTDATASAVVDVTWTTGTTPRFAYRVRLAAARRGERWLVRWRERNVHPALDRLTRLGTVVDAGERGDLLDRDGKPLVTERATVDVAVETDRVGDPAATARALAGVLDVEARDVERRIRGASRGRFVPIVTLRRSDFEARAKALDAIAGVSVAAGSASLAPSRGFARATLGTVGPATAEQIARSRGRLRAGDVVGQAGLQARLEPRLKGTATRAVVTRFRTTGAQAEVLRRWRGRPGRDVRLRLDRDVQQAAEGALSRVAEKAALVALDPSNGDLLAVANRPTADGYDRALLGRYPPGSTFKVVSTAALLRAGLSPERRVPCPTTTSVGGRSFKNFEGSAQGDVAFSVDFAQSCNTAFVSLTGLLGRGALPRAGADFGFGRQLRPGVPVARSSVPEPRGEVAEAAAMIGQDRVLATPLAMAGVAAAVQDGRWRAPRLLSSAPVVAGPPLTEAPALRELMRAVVQGGTGAALADLPGSPLGKSGTAEYGGGDPPPTHAWFISSRPDVAVAVLVEGGSSGGRVAAPIVRDFLARLR